MSRCCHCNRCTCLKLLQVEGLEARVGRRGHIKVRGGLPMTPPSPTSQPPAFTPDPVGADKGATEDGINIAVQGLELRVRNVYTGRWFDFLQLSSNLISSKWLQAPDKFQGTAVLACIT